MRLDPQRGLGHLTYCTNIHAAEHWGDVERGLREHLPRVKSAVSPGAPMGVGMRLAASAASALRDPRAMDTLRELLGRDFYVFTINGFPYGAFHGQRVKDGAYRPDWSDPQRLAYTDLLADHLAALLPEGMYGSVSSVPCTYKPWLTGGPGDATLLARIVDHLIRHAAHLVALREQSGKTIMLTLEPEPDCLLETVDETVRFFEGHLFADAAVTRLAALTGLARGDAQRALRTHLGVCYDVCHAAVEFEDPAANIARLRAAGIAIGKVQLSSALRVDPVTAAAAEALRAFDEPVYLHQTVQRRDGELQRFRDLAPALAGAAEAEGAEWRSHFHVPVFLEHMEHFSTTQDFLRQILALHLETPVTEHLEVETYTWDVLPERYRREDLSAAIARELDWVKRELGCAAADPAADSRRG
jgi:hypothetical protein